MASTNNTKGIQLKLPEYKDQETARKGILLYVMQDGEEFKDLAIRIAQKWGLVAVLPEALRSRVDGNKVVQPQIEHEEGKVSQLEIWLDNFITQDKEMLTLKEHVRILSPIDYPVLIQGETGTGKEILANALHGDRKGKFVALNCAGMPEHLIESELFGYVRGAFTGAAVDKKGLMEYANGGTLLLDEIGDLNYNVQAKFLRALQEKRIRPVGSNGSYPISCRIVAASHHSLPHLVKEGKFRADLLARLDTFELFTKPLRNRLEDIPLIVKNLDSTGKFPLAEVDWTKVDLSHNYRSMQKYIKRWEVLQEKPKYNSL